MNRFFERNDVPILTVKELFKFITDKELSKPDQVDAGQDVPMETAAHRSAPDLSKQEQIDGGVFKRLYIPKSLFEIRPSAVRANGYVDSALHSFPLSHIPVNGASEECDDDEHSCDNKGDKEEGEG